MANFYNLSVLGMLGEINVILVDGNTVMDCDVAEKIFSCQQTMNKLEGVVAIGSKKYDATSNSCLVPNLFSEEFFDHLERHSFTGYKKIPVSLRSKKGENIIGYSALCISGKSGPINDAMRTPVIPSPKFPGGPTFVQFKSAFFDESTWDGRDFFIPENTKRAVVSEKVAHSFKSNPFKNVGIIPLANDEKFLTNDNIIKHFGRKFFDELKDKNYVF